MLLTWILLITDTCPQMAFKMFGYLQHWSYFKAQKHDPSRWVCLQSSDSNPMGPARRRSKRVLSPVKLVPLLLILTWIGERVCIKVGSALDTVSPITGKKFLAVSLFHRFHHSRGFAGSKQFTKKQRVSLTQQFSLLSDCYFRQELFT